MIALPGLSGLSSLVGAAGGGGGSPGSDARSPAAAASSNYNAPSVAWTSPGNALADDSSYASVTLLPGEKSEFLDCTDFGFAFPGGTAVTSIKVEVKAKTLSGTAADERAVLLLTNGPNPTGEFSDDLAGGVAVTTSEAYLPGSGGYGGDPAAAWGTAGLSPGVVAQATWGFRWACRNDGVDPVTVRVNHIRMSVEWE